MPDHPSWPAELVEKGATAIHDVMVRCFGAKPNTEENMAAAVKMAEAVLSALSGDLVPREDLRETVAHAQFWGDETYRFKRQADALAEALEELCGWIDEAVEACDINTAAEARNTARCRLASIRKTTSGASGETEGEG